MDKERQCKNISTYSDSKMKETYKFRLTSMHILLGISGCYNVSTKTKIGKLQHKIIRLYQSIIALSIFGNIVRRAWIMYWIYDDKVNFLSYVSNILYQFNCVTNFLLCWKVFSDRFGNQRKMMEYISEVILPTLESAGIIVDKRAFKRKQVIVTIISILLMSIGPIMWIMNYYIFTPSPQYLKDNNITLSFTEPLPDSYISRTSVVIPGIVCDLSLVTIAFYLVTVCLMLKTILSSFNKAFEEQLCENKSKCIENLENFRGIHFKLCETIEGFDKDFGYFYASVHFWSLVMCIVVLYFMVKMTIHYIGLLIQLYYLGLCMGLLFTVAIWAAAVHVEAHKPLSFIYKMEIQHMDSTTSAQLTMFLSKLTGSQTGFTTCGLLLITKEFIVSIAGAFVTYFAVLYTL